MTPTVAVIGCLDTKGEELAYLRDRIAAAGCATHVIDTGVIGIPRFPGDTPREAVATAGGTALSVLAEARDRGRAVTTMAAGAATVVRELWDRGAIHAVIAAGGSANTTIGAAAMRALPVGAPKVLVSTLASGDVSQWVGTKDIFLLYSVVDVAGVNRLSARVLGNAATAVAAMARGTSEHSSSREEPGRPLVAATMFGVTTPCVDTARRLLEEAGYEVLVFHATGTGGRAMEDLIEDGFIAGVLDLTTTELADEHVGGILSAGSRRLTVAAAKGIPQVVSVGALDMVNFGPEDTVPERFRSRRLYRHNAAVTLMRTTPEESSAIGATIARRLAGAVGPVRVLLPLRGVSAIDKEGEPFHDPEADARLFEAIRGQASPRTSIIEIDTDINDPIFAQACAKALIELLESPASTHRKDTR